MPVLFVFQVFAIITLITVGMKIGRVYTLYSVNQELIPGWSVAKTPIQLDQLWRDVAKVIASKFLFV